MFFGENRFIFSYLFSNVTSTLVLLFLYDQKNNVQISCDLFPIHLRGLKKVNKRERLLCFVLLLTICISMSRVTYTARISSASAADTSSTSGTGDSMGMNHSNCTLQKLYKNILNGLTS